MPNSTEAEIRLLPEALANQIAAGEVVQRPASVVKELLENAVDAGAASVQLIVKKAGKTLIQVVDDGKGMSPMDARMAFERHATSKIRNLDDLFNILTLGFRGEALASIAAVAHVSLKTRREQDALGVSVEIAGGTHVKTEPCQTPNGASISVSNLFYNVPARRNFLKTDPVELKHIIQEFLHAALANPSIAFELIRDGSSLHKLPAQSLPERLSALYGFISPGDLKEARLVAPELNVTGWVGLPKLARKQRGEQFWFVNGRFIKSNYLNHAVAGAYSGLLPVGSHPVFALQLEIPPEQIDINIHPTKTEIKFENERQVYALVSKAVRNALAPFASEVTPTAETNETRSVESEKQNEIEDGNGPNESIGLKDASSERKTNSSARTPAFKKQARFDLDDFLNRNPFANRGAFPRQETLPLEEEDRPKHREVFDEESEATKAAFATEKLVFQSAGLTLFLAGGELFAIRESLCAEALANQKSLDALREYGSKPLMEPIALQIGPQETAALKASATALAAYGFKLTFQDEERAMLLAIPSVINEGEAEALLAEIAALHEIRATDDPEELGALLAELLQKRGKNERDLGRISFETIRAAVLKGKLPERNGDCGLLWRKIEADEINRFFEKK